MYSVFSHDPRPHDVHSCGYCQMGGDAAKWNVDNFEGQTCVKGLTYHITVEYNPNHIIGELAVKRINILIQSVLILCLPILMLTPSYAQDHSFGKMGTTELAGSISFESVTLVSNGNTGDATTILSFAPEIGYFVADGFELALSAGITDGMVFPPGLTSEGPSGGSSTTLVQFFISPSYNFVLPESKVYPFLEAKLGFTDVDVSGGSASGFSWGARGGIKIPVVEHFLITSSVQYLLITLNPDHANNRYGFNYFSFGFGVSGYF